MNDRMPTTDDIREAWVVWSAWKRVPTKGRKAAEREFEQWRLNEAGKEYSSGFNDYMRIVHGDLLDKHIDEVNE